VVRWCRCAALILCSFFAFRTPNEQRSTRVYCTFVKRRQFGHSTSARSPGLVRQRDWVAVRVGLPAPFLQLRDPLVSQSNLRAPQPQCCFGGTPPCIRRPGVPSRRRQRCCEKLATNRSGDPVLSPAIEANSRSFTLSSPSLDPSNAYFLVAVDSHRFRLRRALYPVKAPACVQPLRNCAPTSVNRRLSAATRASGPISPLQTPLCIFHRSSTPLNIVGP